MRRLTALVALLHLVLLGAAMPVAAQDLEFGEPEATASLGAPVVFSTSIRAAAQPESVELLVNLPGDRALTVLPAQVSGSGGQWRAQAVLDGHVVPNTRFSYRFRVREAGGAAAVLGPQAQAAVVDERFEWRTIEGGVVRLHWYEGDEAFARRALDIGQGAVDNASALLGVVETEPIDFFIYASEPDMRAALGEGTRENVGGQAHANIRTMFGLIGPHEVNSDWVDVLVSHELTHLVFDTATDNLYHSPPRWLNEGVAVYLSEGYTREWRSVMDAAVRQRSVIPLDGLAGMFPTTFEQFRLAYAESVSAVDFFIAQYGEPTLWDLVRSYAQGVSDDDAFRAASGGDLAQFNAAWMASLGLDVPQPFGPQVGQPGPLPPGWDSQPGGAPSTPAPGQTPLSPDTPPATTAPGAQPSPAPSPGQGAGTEGRLVVGMVAGLLVVAGLVAAGLLARRRLLR